MRFLRSIPLDPHDEYLNTREWGLRSMEDDPARTLEGARRSSMLTRSRKAKDWMGQNTKD